jgi:hypothetical protein
MRGKLTCDGGVVVNGGRRGGLTVVCNRRCWLFFLFSVFSFSLSSIITSPSLCFSVLFLFFSGYGGAASDSVEAAGDGSRRGTVTAAAVLLLPCAEIPTFIFLSYFPLFFSI